MTDNTQVGLKRWCEAFIDGDISAGQFKRAIRIWHTRKLNEAIREEWALISEVAHSANITAELFISKARKDRIAELDTINAGESNENI